MTLTTCICQGAIANWISINKVFAKCTANKNYLQESRLGTKNMGRTPVSPTREAQNRDMAQT